MRISDEETYQKLRSDGTIKTLRLTIILSKSKNNDAHEY